MNNINLKNTSSLQELEASLSTLNVPIVMFKLLLDAIRTNDFSKISQTMMKERYFQSEDLVTTHIDNVVYQNIYNHEDYNNIMLLITKIFSVINTLVTTRRNITNVYELDSDIINDILISYGFDIYDIFDFNSRQNIAYKIYSFLRKKGTPNLLGDFLVQLGYTFFTINEYDLNRTLDEWYLVPDTVYYSDVAKQYKNVLVANDMKLSEVDDILWYLDEQTLDSIALKNTFIYPKNWLCTYNLDNFKHLQKYLNLPDYISIKEVGSFNFNSFTNKAAVVVKLDYPVSVDHDNIPLNKFRISYDVEDGHGNVMATKPVADISGPPQFKTKTVCYIINTKNNNIETKYVLYDQEWYDYYLQEYLDAYSAWQPNTQYLVGSIVIHNGVPKECIRTHLSGTTFNYNQDGEPTWIDVRVESNWWVKNNYISAFNCSHLSDIACAFMSDKYLLFTSSDDNTNGMMIDTFRNVVSTLSFNNIVHIINNMSLTDYLNDNSLHIKQSYDYNEFLFILFSNDIIVINKANNTWFSMKYDLLDKLTITFNIDLGSRPLNKFMCTNNFMYFIDNTSGVIGFDVYKLENYVQQCSLLNTLPEREVFTQNISNDIFIYDIIDEFYLDDNISFFIGRDKRLYVSGKVINYDYNSSNYRSVVDDYMCICYDMYLERSIQILHSGSLLRIIGMDCMGNLRCVDDNNFKWQLFLYGDIYYKVDTQFIITFKPILDLAYYDWLSYNTPNLIITTYEPLQIGPLLDPQHYNEIVLL